MQIEDRDLTQIIFQFPCKKVSKDSETNYEVFILEKFILIGKNAQNLKYELPIILETHIKWDVQDYQEDGKKKGRLISFRFQKLVKSDGQTKSKIICFKAGESDLMRMKDMIRNKVIFQRIQDVYVPLQTLGKGSSARVLLVFHKNTEKYYAAKCVDKAYLNESENGIESMFQEIRLQRLMDHPSFIKLHSVYEGDNTFYLVMDLLQGKSLHEELNSHRNGFPLDVCKNIMLQILRGIEYMHALDIMHRDLKPENIMMMKKNDLDSLKIVDFGLATFQNADTYYFPKCGTPGYVAPEIANLEDKTKKYDKVCDIFSAGVIFYKCITGNDLFPGNGFNVVLKLNKICKVDLTALQMKKVPAEVIALISKMLEKDPTKRPYADEILKHPFFTGPESKVRPTPAQKKQFFQGLKTNQMAQTAEFALNSDEFTHQKPHASIMKKNVNQGQQSKPSSFIVQDNAYKALAQQSSPHQKPRFNTSEFDQYDLNKRISQIPDRIEEEEEKK